MARAEIAFASGAGLLWDGMLAAFVPPTQASIVYCCHIVRIADVSTEPSSLRDNCKSFTRAERVSTIRAVVLLSMVSA